MSSASRSGLDPATFEVVENAFASVCNEMALDVKMSAYSVIICEGSDFSATLYEGDGRSVAQGENDLPSHAGSRRQRAACGASRLT